MPDGAPLPPLRGVFVTDFDGTLTRREFYQLVQNHLVTPGKDYWTDYRNGRMSHFEAMSRYFADIRADEATVVRLLLEIELDPRFGELATKLNQAGWEIVVASAGSDWYIEQVLGPTAAKVTIHANPGRWVGGDRGLVLDPPVSSPFYCPRAGINKAEVVRDAMRRAGKVAFAGDGIPDVPAAVLVPLERRFAKADCAAALRERGEPYRAFDHWSEVAEALLAEG